MIKSRHIIRLVTILAALCLLFSISSFADGYSFQNDGDQWNQRFSGTNKVYTDGIYVGEMGAIDAYMDNYGNTYNGTNIIDATAYPGAGQDDNSTYNGSLDVTANDIVSSKTTIDDATVNASTSVVVNDVLAENNLNAGVQFNNSNFNNDVTLSGSGAVNLEGSTVNNLVLGNIPQMNNLLDIMYLYSYNWSHMLYSTNSSYAPTIVNPYTGNTLSVPVFPFRLFYLGWDQTNHQFAMSQDLYYGNLLGFLQRTFMASYGQAIVSIGQYLNYQYNLARSFKTYTFTLSNNGETYSLVASNTNVTFFTAIINRFDIIIDLLNYHANRFFAWLYPLRSESSQYWKAYNTDTGEYDDVNPATVFAYITWYLGQLYNDASNVTETMHDMTDDINTAATTFQNMEQKEQAAIDQISQGFETFLPDVNTFSSFRAITWCSNYLQQIYLALGSYGTVIFIALLFGVCLQFIGYFRYK